MLVNLNLSNFAIVEQLEVEFKANMTTITGETGAGKSIAIDALGLCLGERSLASMVRAGEQKADLSVCFNLTDNKIAKDWLVEHDLDDGDDCILRRVITCEGRSRGYINGSLVPASKLRSLGQYLINIHGQHASYLMMQANYQLSLLDAYAGHKTLLDNCASFYNKWLDLKKKLAKLEQELHLRTAEKELLTYQLAELNELALEEGEFEKLEKEHKILANSEHLSELAVNGADILYNGEQNILNQMQVVLNKVEELSEYDLKAQEFVVMLKDAIIQIEESGQGLNQYWQAIEIDPARFSFLENRLTTILAMAKKHQVDASALVEYKQKLSEQLAALNQVDSDLTTLKQELELAAQLYLENALKLTASRHKYAGILSKKITASMHSLHMEHGIFKIEIAEKEDTFSPLGMDKVSFKVSTNPGQPLDLLSKVASGGEISRIALAIQVITAKKVKTPSLIFDEVDVGISGSTAAIVGKLLQKLGKSTQVICVTHLPQVAAAGAQQFYVTKETDGMQTKTTMTLLEQNARVHEIARLLAGGKITANSLANAEDLLQLNLK